MKLLKFIFISILAMVMVSCSSYDEPKLEDKNLDIASINMSVFQYDYTSRSSMSRQMVRLYRQGNGGTCAYSFRFDDVDVVFYGPPNMQNGAIIRDCRVYPIGDLFGVSAKMQAEWHCLSGGSSTGLNVVVYYIVNAQDDNYEIGQRRNVQGYTFWIDFDNDRVVCDKMNF